MEKEPALEAIIDDLVINVGLRNSDSDSENEREDISSDTD